MASDRIPVIAVDGPGGSGKGTLCRRISQILSWHLLDSGAIYRLLALAVTEQGIADDDADAIVALAASLDMRFVADENNQTHSFIGERDVSDAIRTEACGDVASKIAAIQPVRDALLQKQRDFAKFPGLVADGRDMGTVVFRRAELKIFLTASAEERAQRRYKQLKEKGFDVNLPALLEDIQARDERDQNRAVAPLVPAEDAIAIDSSAMSIDQVVGKVLELVDLRGMRS